MTIPCKECIVMAICKQKDEIQCKVLYEYFCIMRIEHLDIRRFNGYNIELLTEVEKYFDKYIRGTVESINEISFTTNRKKAISIQKFIQNYL